MEYLVIREAKKRIKSIPQNPQSDSWGEADILCEISKSEESLPAL
jgi:hypothetical protein